MQLLLQVIRAGIAPVMTDQGAQLFDAMQTHLIELSGGKPAKKKPNDKKFRHGRR